MKKSIRKESNLQIFIYFCLALSLVSTITYMMYTILLGENISNQIFTIIGTITLAIFSILLVMIGIFTHSKKTGIFLVISSLLLTFYSTSNIMIKIFTPKDFVLDFTNKDIKEVVTWAEKREILIEQEFQYSDTIPRYKVINQSIKKDTPTKNLNKIKVIVSDGIDPNQNTTITNMVGWKLDDVIKFIDENHLTNVTIDFQFDNKEKKDIIISQDIIKDIKRNEPIHLVSSLGRESELKSTTMENLVGLDTFHANIYCGRNYLNCVIEYAYSEEKEEETILKQSIKKWTVVSPNEKKELILTVARKNKITVPDLFIMDATEITTWATNNRLKIEFKEQYDDSIKKGKVISSNVVKGSTIEVGNTVEIVLSKGPIYMISFTNIDDFIKWAEEFNVSYTIDYQYSTSILEGKLISSSHKEKQLVKNTDTIQLIISQGSSTIVPNLLGINKEEATKNCDKAMIKCKFVYLNDKDTYTIVTKQSMRSGSNVPINTTVTLTLGK